MDRAVKMNASACQSRLSYFAFFKDLLEMDLPNDSIAAVIGINAVFAIFIGRREAPSGCQLC